MSYNKTATLTNATSKVVDANGSRKTLIITNSGSGDAYLGFSEPAVVGYGIFLKASGGSYNMDIGQEFLGQVNGISAAGTTLSIVEL